MLGEYFHHETFRNVIIAFGNLFNDVRLSNEDGSFERVPIQYGPREKYLNLAKEGGFDGTVRMTLPAMSFRITDVTYASSRKKQKLNKIIRKSEESGNEHRYTFVSTPFDVRIELGIIARKTSDAFMIMEQILPFFDPEFNVKVRMVRDLALIADVPIIAESISMEDLYEGSNEGAEVKLMNIAITFLIKTELFGPIRKSPIIKKAITQHYSVPTALDFSNAEAVSAHLDDPTATSLSNADSRLVISVDPFSANIDDDYGFSEEWVFTKSNTESSV